MVQLTDPRELRSEQVTMATDLLLAVVAGFLAVLLLRGWTGGGSPYSLAWGLTLATTALAAVTGGLFHGLRHRLRDDRAQRLWSATLLLSAAVGFFLLIAAAFATPYPPVRYALLLVAAMKLLAVAHFALRSGSFAVVAWDSGASLLLLGGVVGAELWVRSGGGGGGWILGGVGISLAGALLQLKGVRAGRTFDHNDLFHLVQAVACYLFYLGAGQA